MCGIAGVWRKDRKIDKPSMRRMLRTIAHRGPDGEGVYVDRRANLILGHRRLSILDTSDAGLQPMEYMNRYWIVFNGEVYNFLELKKELENLGYKFRTRTDTEIVMAAFDKWGEKCLEKFNGMWALAIWDKKKESIFLARDRFGIKPLAFVFKPGKLLAFASELCVFDELPTFKKKIDEKMLEMAIKKPFSLEGVGLSIYKDIYKIPPGHYAKIDASLQGEVKRWWSTLQHLVEVPRNYNRQVEKFRRLFEDACRLRLRSDVPVASAVSGGIDSMCVYSFVKRAAKAAKKDGRLPKEWNKAYVAVFENTGLDESDFARAGVDYIGGKARYIKCRLASLLKNIEKSTLHSGIVSVSQQIASVIYEFMAQDRIKVSMDGHGVDEMLFGYQNLVGDYYLFAWEGENKKLARQLWKIYLGMNTIEERERIKRDYPGPDTAKWRHKMHALAKVLREKYQSENNSVADLLKLKSPESLNIVSPYFQTEDLSGLNKIEKQIYINFHQTTLPSILRNFDQASMLHGVEVRMPFLDWRLVCFVFSLPLSSRVGGGYTKRILRDAAKGVIAEKVRRRKIKIGLNAPMQEWFGGEMKEWVLREVNSEKFLKSELWDGKKIRGWVREKIRTNSWSLLEAGHFWRVLNAHLLLSRG